MAYINVLSFLAIGTASYFFMLIYQRTMSTRDKQNLWTIVVLATLAWWNLCDAFFYVAATKETAWLWHRLGAPGWCGFIAVTGYYFLIFTGTELKMKRYMKILYWIPPIALTLRFMFFFPSPMAQDLVQSTSGLGWTFVQNFQNMWTFLFLFYLLVYMGGPLLNVYFWEKTLTSRSEKILAKGFLILDSIVVAIGFVSIFALPYFTSFLPPAGCVATLIFGIWYWGWLRDYDFLYVELALNPGFIFETCIDAMLVADEDYKILYANREAKTLLGVEQPKGCLYTEYFQSSVREQLVDFIATGNDKIVLSDTELVNGTPVICSITRIEARRRKFKVCIICLKEIQELKAAQERLDYLAHYDELTGLVNRRRLDEILKDWEEQYRSRHEDFEMMFLDLTRFKQINDTFGHESGDKALIAVADTLRKEMVDGEVLARFAGDEFVVLHRRDDSREMNSIIKKKIQQMDCTSFASDIQMGVDIGSCRYSEAGSVGNLFKLADKRMYKSKKLRSISRNM